MGFECAIDLQTSTIPSISSGVQYESVKSGDDILVDSLKTS